MGIELRTIILALGGLALGALIKGPAMPAGKRWPLWWLPNHLIPAMVFGAGAGAGSLWLGMPAWQGGLTAAGLSTGAAELLKLVGVSPILARLAAPPAEK